MKPLSFARLGLFAATAAALAGVALVAQQAQTPAGKMADAAQKFLGALTPEQKQKATFAFDDPHRTRWFFTPQQDKQKNFTRKGVRLEELDAKQKAAALDLLRAGLSATGYDQATTIVSLETLLAELETNGAMVRNSNWYFVSVFGDPSGTAAWGWRFEGHHLSVNMTLEKGQVVASSPVLFGANPAELKQGPRKGERILPAIEDHAKALIASLTDEQRKAAAQPKQLPEIKEGVAEAGVGSPVGLPAAKLTDAQKAQLWKLLEAYAGRLPAEVASAELAKVKDAGLDKLFFAYHLSESDPGKPYTYRVHGPTFVVEFLNVQKDAAGNPANHIHSGWRRLPTDFPKGG